MSKINAPTSSDELRDLVSDPSKAGKYFSPEAIANGSFKGLLDAYAEDYKKRNRDTTDEVRTQVQSVLAETLREAGTGNTPRVNISASGSPVMIGADGKPVAARGQGTLYNKNAPGAVFEQKYKPEDRFGSIGEMCQAIREERSPSNLKNREALLNKLTRVREFMNSFGSEDGGAGGFLIPEIMRSELMVLALEDSIVRSRATVIPMSTLSVPIPTVDDTSHASSVFGGVTFNWTEESQTIAESQAKFGNVTLTAKVLAGLFRVPNQLLADAPAFSGFFDAKVPSALAFFEDLGFFTGSGAGEPQGFINCPAAVQVAAESGQASGTIVWENLAGMYQRMLPTSIKNAVWIANINTFKELATMALSVGTGGGPVWIGGWAQPGSEMPPVTILGRPVIFTEKAPALGTTGDISFVDLSYYLIGDRQQIEITSSDQRYFELNQTGYRLLHRVDGRPWLQSALTPHTGSSTLSAFVQLASR